MKQDLWKTKNEETFAKRWDYFIRHDNMRKKFFDGKVFGERYLNVQCSRLFDWFVPCSMCERTDTCWFVVVERGVELHPEHSSVSDTADQPMVITLERGRDNGQTSS